MSLSLNPNNSESPLFDALRDLSTAYDEDQFNAQFAGVFHGRACRCEHCADNHEDTRFDQMRDDKLTGDA